MCSSTSEDPPWWKEWIVDDSRGIGSEAVSHHSASDPSVQNGISGLEFDFPPDIFDHIPLTIAETCWVRELQSSSPLGISQLNDVGFGLNFHPHCPEDNQKIDTMESLGPGSQGLAPSASLSSGSVTCSTQSERFTSPSNGDPIWEDVLGVQGDGKVGIRQAKTSFPCSHCNRTFTNELQYRQEWLQHTGGCMLIYITGVTGFGSTAKPGKPTGAVHVTCASRLQRI